MFSVAVESSSAPLSLSLPNESREEAPERFFCFVEPARLIAGRTTTRAPGASSSSSAVVAADAVWLLSASSVIVVLFRSAEDLFSLLRNLMRPIGG